MTLAERASLVNIEQLTFTMQMRDASSDKLKEVFKAIKQNGADPTQPNSRKLIESVIEGNKCKTQSQTRVLFGLYERQKVEFRNHTR
jgi:hypothetical protein